MRVCWVSGVYAKDNVCGGKHYLNILLIATESPVFSSRFSGVAAQPHSSS